MDISLGFCEKLSDFQYLRRVLYYASARPGWWTRTLCGDRLSSLVYNTKIEHWKNLEEIFKRDSGFWSMLSSGRSLGFEAKVVPWLDFSSPGRTVASLSLLTYIVDTLDKQTQLSPDYILDSICGPVCFRLKTLVSIRKMQQAVRGQEGPIIEEVD
ncbi:E1B 19K [Bovine mastadenovirus A]|uniref:E1B 19K n=1 Tax=Bovine mastadenovirus A TaxID=129953 RepID=UPI0000443F87|nr:E1B 19K [Bovine mastadenovirus A]